MYNTADYFLVIASSLIIAAMLYKINWQNSYIKPQKWAYIPFVVLAIFFIGLYMVPIRQSANFPGDYKDCINCLNEDDSTIQKFIDCENCYINHCSQGRGDCSINEASAVSNNLCKLAKQVKRKALPENMRDAWDYLTNIGACL